MEGIGETIWGIYSIMLGTIIGSASLQIASSNADILYRGAGAVGAVAGATLIGVTFYEGIIKDWLRYHPIRNRRMNQPIETEYKVL